MYRLTGKLKRYSSFFMNSEIKNFLYLAVIKIVDLVIPLLVFPYIAKKLGPSNLGVYVILQTMIIFASVVGDYGYITNGTHRIAKHSGDTAALGSILNQILPVRFLLSLLAGLLAIFVSIVVYHVPLGWIPVLLLINVIFNSLNLAFFFQGIGKIRSYALVFTISRLSMLPMLYILVEGSGDIVKALAVSVVPAVIGAFYSILYARQFIGFRFASPNIYTLKKEIYEGWHYFLPNLYSIFLTSFGVLGLRLHMSSDVVGGYAAMERIVKAVAGILGVVNQVAYPKVAVAAAVSESEGVKKIIHYAKTFMPIVVLATLTLMLLGPLASLLLYGYKYASYDFLLRYLPLYIFLAGVNTFIGVIYMTIFGMEKEYSKSFLYGTCAAMAIYFFAPYYIGINAPALGIIVGELIITISIVMFIRRGKNV